MRGRNRSICSTFSNWSGKILTSKTSAVRDSLLGLAVILVFLGKMKQEE